ncbi:MAG: hypothetical protein K6E79_06395 [Pseudobutyrivibrio sp.]|nr:hypothetical protein [Pseudobutyrivibrio sp.]
MKICLGTVIYKQAVDFLPDLLKSVDNQTDKDFDLLIVNDNYKKDELISAGVLNENGAIADIAPSISGQIRFVDLEPMHCSIASTRINMIRAAKEMGYDLLIVSDADDTFASTRVDRYRKTYEIDKTYAFYYNELVTDTGETVLEDMPEVVDSARIISQSNFIGMSIAAINLNLIDDAFIDSLSEGDCPVFDWYFYTRLLMDVGAGHLVTGAATIYRIHENNQVGTTHDVQQEYSVKLTHYKNLAKRYPYFGHLYDDLKALDINKIDTSQSHKGYWWSNIIMEDSYEI